MKTLFPIAVRSQVRSAGCRNNPDNARFIPGRSQGDGGMPKENDLEGRQDMGGKHGGQAGMPKPETRTAAQQGIVRDDKGQEQPADKSRAQQK